MSEITYRAVDRENQGWHPSRGADGGTAYAADYGFERDLPDRSLDELATHDPRLAEVVDLKYFCGYTFDDIAAQSGTSKRTVQRDWEKARVILFHIMSNLT